MKAFALILFISLAFISCKDDEVTPVIIPDLFVGSWTYHNSALELDVAFNVSKVNGEYSFSNIIIEYPEIPLNADYSLAVEVYDKFADGDGFGRIRIRGGDDTSWIFINLFYNNIVNGGSKSTIYVMNMQIDMINREAIELENQVFTKLN